MAMMIDAMAAEADGGNGGIEERREKDGRGQKYEHACELTG